MAAPESFLLSSGFAEILRAAGLGEDALDAFRMLEEARQLVILGEMESEEYDSLAKGVQLQMVQLASGGSLTALPKPVLAGKNITKDVAPSVVRAPVNEKPIVESYLDKLPVHPKTESSAKIFKKRYIVLYKTCVMYYEKQGDTKPKGRVDLTPDFFVQDSKEHAHGFVLSDMTTSLTLGAESEELKGYWVHMCAMVLRKIQTAETPVDLAAEGEDQFPSHDDEEDEISKAKKQYEKRMAEFKREKEKGNRRKSFFDRKVKQKEEEIAKAAAAEAIAATTKDLKEKELTRQKELEELQRKLEEAERDKQKYKTEAELEHERAEKEHQQALETHSKLTEVEARLAKTLEDFQAESREREAKLLAEREETEARLNQVQARRRMSVMPGAQVDPAVSEALEKEVKALKAKLDALQDALNVDLGNLDWDGTLEDAEKKMKDLVPALCSEDEKEAREAQATFDQWDKIIRNHADYKAREEQKMVEWENQQRPKNLKALEEMKKIVPFEVTTGVSMEFLTGQCHLSPEVSQRIMKTKILQFYYMDPEVIAKIHIADLSSRYVPQGLDIRELRAVYAVLPKEFQLDSDGKKKVWRDAAREKLKQMTEKEEAGTLSKNEALHPAYRPKDDKKGGVGGGSAPPGGAGGGKLPVNPMAGALAGLFAGRGGPPGGGGGGPPGAPKLDTSALQNALAAKLGGGPPSNPLLAAKLADSAAAAEKQAKKQDADDLLSMIKKKPQGDGAAAPTPAAAEPTPAAAPQGVLKASSTAVGGNKGTSGKKTTIIVESPKVDGDKKPPPMIDMGVKFNAAAADGGGGGGGGAGRKNTDMGTSAVTEGMKEQWARIKGRTGTITEDEFEGDVPAYDFEKNYAAAHKRKSWVDDGMFKLQALIDTYGVHDAKEGGKKSLKFKDLIDKYGDGSDMVSLCAGWPRE